MKILYTTGTKRLSMGKAGAFDRGIAKEVNQELAEKILKKKTIKFYPEGKVPKEALEAMKRLEAAEKAAPENMKQQAKLRDAKKAAAAKLKKKEG